LVQPNQHAGVGRAVARVVVRAPLDLPGPHGQHRLCSILDESVEVPAAGTVRVELDESRARDLRRERS
jgi:hypothetical protein